jgi:predicted 3-demethylubiquinone-9 3-methyltransferase (glyoxalase superfamily)
MNKITPFLWYNDQAEEAAKFYVSVFKQGKIHCVSRRSGKTPGSDDPVMSVTFELEGQQFIALNGGPHFSFTPAISLFVDCKDQAEVDELWKKLTADGGEESRCGWLKDRYGLSWQIIPHALGELLKDKDPAKAGRVMQAMLKMGKIEVKALEEAYAG